MPTTEAAIAAPATDQHMNENGSRKALPTVEILDLASRLGVLYERTSELRTDTLCGHEVRDCDAQPLACGEILCDEPGCHNEHLIHCADDRAVVLAS
jgi:hypothetical protein